MKKMIIYFFTQAMFYALFLSLMFLWFFYFWVENYNILIIALILFHRFFYKQISSFMDRMTEKMAIFPPQESEMQRSIPNILKGQNKDIFRFLIAITFLGIFIWFIELILNLIEFDKNLIFSDLSTFLLDTLILFCSLTFIIFVFNFSFNLFLILYKRSRVK